MAFPHTSTTLKKLIPIVQNTLTKLIQNEMIISGNAVGEKSSADFLKDQNFPTVCIHLQTGDKKQPTMHLFFLKEEFVLQFYGWLINDKPDKQISDDHYEGLKEAVQQVFGQIKMNIADDSARYMLEQVNVFPIDAADKVANLMREASGLELMFEVTVGNYVSKVNYFCWDGLEALPKNEQADDRDSSIVNVQPAEFGELKGNGAEMEKPRNVEMLMDVDLEVSVELDRKTLLVSELLKLGKGSIVELEKSAGEPLDIYVNGRKFAEGEVVVIDDRFGIRITQLASPKERVKSLG